MSDTEATHPAKVTNPYVLVVLDRDTGEVTFEHGNGVGRAGAIALLRETLDALTPQVFPNAAWATKPKSQGMPVSPFPTDI